MKEKVTVTADKHAWHPSPLVGQVVLVTTLNDDGTSNIAPKSWVSMMAFGPPLLAVGCNLKHQTCRNILTRREFVVNVPGADLAETVWKCHRLPHPRPVEAAGLRPIPALKVNPPRVAECRAHLECVLDRHLTYGDEVILLGRIATVSIDKDVCEAGDPYERLQAFVFLENGLYGVIERSRRLPEGSSGTPGIQKRLPDE